MFGIVESGPCVDPRAKQAVIEVHATATKVSLVVSWTVMPALFQVELSLPPFVEAWVEMNGSGFPSASVPVPTARQVRGPEQVTLVSVALVLPSLTAKAAIDHVLPSQNA
jgi:hypothetical protein